MAITDFIVAQFNYQIQAATGQRGAAPLSAAQKSKLKLTTFVALAVMQRKVA